MGLTLFNGSFIGTKNTGIGTLARDLIKALSPKNIFLLDPLNIKREGSIKIPSNLSPEYGIKGHIRRLYWLQVHLPQIVRQQKADLILSPLPEAPLLKGIPSVVIAHDLIPLRYPHINIQLAYNLSYVPAILHQAKLVFCNSQATAREINQLIKIPSKKLVPIRLGFDRSKFYPLDLPREDFFLVLGRHNPHKNLKRVLQAFSLIKNQNHKIIFVGPFDKRYTPKLQKYADELYISHLCDWRNWITDQERLKLLNQCKALVIASLWEGFGLPALEAMACGTTVIASNKGALPEVLGNLGIYVNPNNAKDIANAMYVVSKDNTLLNDSRKNGPVKSETFNWDTTASEIESFLN